jgi:aromatic amino acid transport protein AroP
MLYGLAQQGNGPKSLLKVDGRGVPVVAIGISALATALCVLINYLIPGRAFELLMALVVSALVINWAMISLAHLKFRAAKNREGVVPKFKAFWYPFSNYLCLLFMAGILVIMYLTPGIQISVLLIPVWVAILAVGYAIKQRSQRVDGVTSR